MSFRTCVVTINSAKLVCKMKPVWKKCVVNDVPLPLRPLRYGWLGLVGKRLLTTGSIPELATKGY